MKRRYVVLALLFVLALILYIDRGCIGLALPRIQDELQIGPEHLGWIGFAFSLAYGSFEIPSGHMGDRFGPRRVLTRIVVWWSVFTALTGTAIGLKSLLVTRFLFGAGEAGAFPNASATVSRWFPVRTRAAAMGAFQGAAHLGGAVTPLLVVPIQLRYGWRASFFVFSTLGLAWAVVWYAWFRDTPAEKPGIGAAELAELDGAPPPPKRGLPWRVALRDRNLRALVLAWFGAFWSGGFAFWTPTFLVKGRGFTEGELRWLSLSVILTLAGSTSGGFLSDALVARIGRARGRRTIALAGLACEMLVTLTLAATHDKVATIALVGLNGACMALVAVNGVAVCMDIGGSHPGTVTGICNTAGQIAAGLSTVAVGYLVKIGGGYEAPLVVIAGAVVAASVPWWFIDASRKIAADGAVAESR